MKRLLIFPCIILLTNVCIPFAGLSQTAKNTVNVNGIQSLLRVNKEEEASQVANDKKVLWSTIHIKALSDFEKSYNSTNEKWYSTVNGYVARFTSNGEVNRIFYDQKGNFVYSIRQYDEFQLPVMIRHIIKQTYYDHSITLVEELNFPTVEKQYVVHMQDAKTWTNVLVKDDDAIVIETTRK
ncbi:MAG: hypothetical protein V4717_01855 [Bacteroidota bacterium]